MKIRLTYYFIIFIITLLLKPSTLTGQSIELIDYPFVSGSYQNGIMDGSLLYCITDFGLIIWDLGNIDTPQLVSKTPLDRISFHTDNTLKYKNYLLVKRHFRLFYCDIKQNENSKFEPMKLSLDCQLNDFTIIDSFLIVSTVCGDGLKVFNISNVENPIAVSNIYLNGSSPDFKRFKNTFYLSSMNEVFIVDFKDGYLTSIDTLEFPHYISTFISNNELLFYTYQEDYDGFFPEHSYVIDLGQPGNPIIDSTTFPAIGYYKFLTDSLLIFDEYGLRSLYSISSKKINQISELVNDVISENAILYNDTLLINFKSTNGFDVFNYLFPDSFMLIANNIGGGSWIRDIQYDGHEKVMLVDIDTIHVISKATNNELRKIPCNANALLVKDSLLFECYYENPSKIELSIFTHQYEKIHVYDFPADGYHFRHFKIFNNKIYHYGFGIYNISDPNHILLISASCLNKFDSYYNDMLIEYDHYLTNVISFYDSKSEIPSLIKSERVPNVPCKLDYGFSIKWVENESRAYCYGFDQLFHLDFSDTSNIHFTNCKVIPVGTGYSISFVHDSILYNSSNNGIAMFDMCDEYHFRHISTIYLGGYIQKLKFVDSILYVSYGGFVARYRLKEISPCQVYTWNDIKDFQHLKKIRVYPNPNYGNFKIDLNNKPYKIIRIFDIHGRVVYCQNIGNALYYENVNIYVDLPAGIYFLNLVTNHNTTTEKVIIK